LLLVDGSVGDRHTQLDGAHDRVGNNGWRTGSSLRQGSPRWRGWSSLGTRIVTHRGPTSAQRHDPTARYPPTTSALSFTKSLITRQARIDLSSVSKSQYRGHVYTAIPD
jgi:hypothetical protein